MVANVVQVTDSKKHIEYVGRYFEEQREAFRRNPMPALSERRANLKRLKRALLTHETQLTEAIDRDFSCRSADETRIAEIMPSILAIDYTIKHLDQWMKPSKRKVSMLFQPATNKVHYQPLGVCGVIVPWNYPVFLAVGPMISALAAGNRVMVKMSEFTPHTSALFKELMETTFPLDLVAVVTGEADVAAHFSSRPFDHLLFTGSTTVGKMVMKAASEHLTPVTLELGGKSPAIISTDVPLEDAAHRLAFGKAINAGQTCVAPDYVLCPADRVQTFVDEFRKQFAGLYPNLRDNDDYTAIINDKQYNRLQAYLEDAKRKGAELVEINPAQENLSDGTRKMAITLVLNARDDMDLMQDEIFGPILPVIGYDTLDQAIQYVNDRPRPLSLYYFGYETEMQDHVLNQTHSGGVCINDTLMHVCQDDMPFGGIGTSGMGHYHGKEGFLTFSHAKSVFSKQRFNSSRFLYPPYGTALHRMVYKMFIR
ncbi:MAG: coniferyl aldehyde dehydrogenase [Oleiphilaceae bacterium]|nr:coniferyl aldehyde dehydrogenase [Oleiphilaceae bacterium]